MFEEIHVIGAGVAGLLTASSLLKSGFNVSIYEEHPQVGLPPHCTGLVSESTFSEFGLPSGSRNLILNKFREYVIVDTESLNRLVLKFREYVYLLNRPLLESVLMEHVVNLGGEVFLSTVAELNADRIYLRNPAKPGRVHQEKTLGDNDIVVIAEGPKRVLSKVLGLCRSSELAYGLQTLVEVSGGDLPSAPHVLVDPAFKGYFGWVVPVSDREFIVGFLREGVATYRLLNYLVREAERIFKFNSIKVRRYFGGPVPKYPPCEPSKGRFVLVGDSLGANKPVSGGGIYAIVNEVNSLVRALKLGGDPLRAYTRFIGRLISEVRREALLKSVVIKAGGYGKLIRVLGRLGIRELKLREYDRVVSLLTLNSLVS